MNALKRRKNLQKTAIRMVPIRKIQRRGMGIVWLNYGTHQRKRSKKLLQVCSTIYQGEVATIRMNLMTTFATSVMTQCLNMAMSLSTAPLVTFLSIKIVTESRRSRSVIGNVNPVHGPREGPTILSAYFVPRLEAPSNRPIAGNGVTYLARRGFLAQS